MSRVKYIFSALRVMALGSLGAGVLNFLALTITAKILEPSAFGVFSVYASVISIVSVVSSFRVDVLIFQLHKIHASVIFMLALHLVSLVSVLVFIVFSFNGVSDYVLSDHVYPYTAYVLAFGVMALGGYQAATAFSLKYKMYKELSLSKSLQAFVGAIVQILLAIIFKYSFIPLVVGFIVNQAFGVRMLVKNQTFPFSWRTYVKFIVVIRRYFKFCAYSSMSMFLLIMSPLLPAVIIAKYIGIEEAGVFYFASQVTTVPFTFIRRLLANVVLAEGKELTSGIYISLLHKYKKVILVVGTFCIITCVAYFLFATSLFEFFLGYKWRSAGVVSAILLPMFMIDSISFSAYQLLNINNRYVALFFMEVFRFIFVVGGVLVVVLMTGDLVNVVVWYSFSMSFFYVTIILMLHILFMV